VKCNKDGQMGVVRMELSRSSCGFALKSPAAWREELEYSNPLPGHVINLPSLF